MTMRMIIEASSSIYILSRLDVGLISWYIDPAWWLNEKIRSRPGYHESLGRDNEPESLLKLETKCT
jgi:hypothetical protein